MDEQAHIKKQLEQAKKQSFQFFKAIQFINVKEDLDDEEIYVIIREAIPDKTGMSSSYLNKLKNAWNNSDHLKVGNLRRYKRFLDFLSERIGIIHNAFWNEDAGDYIKDGEQPMIIQTKSNPDKLEGLIGVWKGYSWNTDRAENGEPPINVFKLHIKGVNDITCEVEMGTFDKGKISLITNDRIEINISNDHRKIILMKRIGFGNKKALLTTSSLKMAYIDSGDKRVKVGLALLERADGNDLFEPGSAELSSFESDMQTKLLEFLNSSQKILE